MARQFVSDGLLIQDMNHGSLKLTPKGRVVLKGEPYLGTPPEIERERSPRRSADQPQDYDVELFERLRSLRLKLATEAGLPPYIIFSDATLRELAVYYPQTQDSFIRIQGVGEAKLARYGEMFLAEIRAYCGERGITEREKATPATARNISGPQIRRTRQDDVVELYQKGWSVTEIAESFGSQNKTVINHLWKSIQDGQNIAPEPLLGESRLSPDERERVLALFAQHGTDFLRPVYDALEESVPWEELHVLRLYFVTKTLKDDTSQSDDAR